MYRQIIVPLDGSVPAEHAAIFAVALARRSGALLRLVRVHMNDVLPAALHGSNLGHESPVEKWDREVREQEQQYLDQMAQRVREFHPGTRVVVEVVDGPVVATLLARSRRADLMVMATHGRGTFARGWLGSVADRVVRESVTPVILVRPGEEPADLRRDVAIKRILVPQDGSQAAEAVLEPALALATLIGAGITLLHVMAPLGDIGPANIPLGGHLEPAGMTVHEATRQLQKIADRTNLPDTQTLLVTHPHPAQGILTAAADVGAGLVALATRGHGGVKRLILGSVADKVIRTADVPVLVVAPRATSRRAALRPQPQ